MIFVLDDSLKEKEYSVDFAKFLVLACERNQKIKCTSTLWNYIEKSVLTTDYLGKWAIELVINNDSLRDISNVYQKAFTTVIVGNDVNMLRLEKAIQMLANTSRVVLENSSYDWPTIKKWIEFFDGKIKTGHKTVNKIVHQAILNKWLVQEHAGGGAGTIVNRLRSLADEVYAEIDKFKLTTVFDSDKNNPNDNNGKNDSLHHYLSEHQIYGHELVKREIENYYSWETYSQANKTSTPNPPTLNEDEYDYLDISACPNIKLHKRDMPEVATCMNPKRLKKRVQNNIGQFGGEYEIQKIILMFAKVI